nr:RNA-directed DNA polymerase, eukaryota [Tanacetum cinerariifolium]
MDKSNGTVSIPFPPGFTPCDETEVECDKKSMGDNKGSVFGNEKGESVSIGSRKSNKIDIQRTGGSLLTVMEELIKVGKTMGYNMEGCLNPKAKKDWIKEIYVSHKVNFLTLQETKMEDIYLIDGKCCWGNYAFEYVYSLAVGNSGGILCVWEKSAFKKNNSTISDYFVMIGGSWLCSGVNLLIISVKGIGFENPSYFEKAKDFRPMLYDEKVIGLGYTPMFLTHSVEALEIAKFKRSRENKIEFAYDYENLNASYVNEKINFEDDYFQEIINTNFEKIDSLFQQTSSLKPYVPNVIFEKIIIDLEDEVVSLLKKEKANLETTDSLKSKGFESSETVSSEFENQSKNDCLVIEKEYLDTFSSVKRPRHRDVIWKKKRSSNTSNVGLSAVSVPNLNKNVKRYSRKDLLACNNCHLGETGSAYMCNDAMNVSCDSRMNDLLDDNNFFIFDDVNVRISLVSKMPFRKKPRDSMHVRSKKYAEKKMLWDYLVHVISKWDGEVIVMGYFNEVQFKNERFGSLFHAHGADAFNRFILQANLQEIPLGGCSFTWCHRSAKKMSKLDRFLMSEGLLGVNPNFSALTLDRYLSDHRPIMLCDSSHDYGPIPFRMYHYWFEIDGFKEMIQKFGVNVQLLRMEIVKDIQEAEKVDNLEAAHKAKIK